MSLTLSPVAEQRLREWIGMETWYKLHALDEHRFYRFVRALWECNRTLIDESALRERILAEVMRHGDWDKAAAEQQIEESRFSGRAQEVMDYHMANGD